MSCFKKCKEKAAEKKKNQPPVEPTVPLRTLFKYSSKNKRIVIFLATFFAICQGLPFAKKSTLKISSL